MARKIEKVMLMLPNYRWFGKRTWKTFPYGIALINATLKGRFESWIYDANFLDHDEERVRKELRDTRPDVVGVSTFSTEYHETPAEVAAIIREELPEAVIVLGGIIPTVLLESAIEDANYDYFVMGEGEVRFRRLLEALAAGERRPQDIDGIAYRRDGQPVVFPVKEFIKDLDAIPYPDYDGIGFLPYATTVHTFAREHIARNYPYGASVTTRGCPYRCVFCAAGVVSGKKVRMRSAENVLREIDQLCGGYGVKEMIFHDDHFLANRERAMAIMRGIKERKALKSWKCNNVAIFALDDEILDLMASSGCYQMTVSIESGDQDVLDKLVKKPVKLSKVPALIERAKKYGMELVSNFVIGFPGETWDQIRRTFAFAEGLPLDVVNFHIATPLPKTELMRTCIEQGFVSSERDLIGYTKGVVSTSEFKPEDLMILRAYEWDRINFSTEERKRTMARLHGLTLEETEEWRRRTRRNLGTTIGWKV